MKVLMYRARVFLSTLQIWAILRCDMFAFNNSCIRFFLLCNLYLSGALFFPLGRPSIIPSAFFLDMCGISIPQDMQGVSFKELVEKGKTPRDWRKSLYYHYYEFPGFHSVRAHYGVKMERYKLMHFYVDDNWELYDLKTDPEEMHNLYGKKGMEKITTELKAELARLQKEYDVPQELCR